MTRLLAGVFALVAAVAYGGVGENAPSLRASSWINGEPSPSGDLHGQVTLIEFWTFDCWNCQNVEPHVRSWFEKFAPQGLRVVGVHSPELPQEREIDNVRRYVAEHGIRYPVAIDNDFVIWRSFGNRAWPTWYLIDVTGRIRYQHVGEGGYAETEAEIEKLLAER